MEVTTTYRIRPHHGMCLYFFEGKGYSEGFTKHMAEEGMASGEKWTGIPAAGRSDG